MKRVKGISAIFMQNSAKELLNKKIMYKKFYKVRIFLDFIDNYVK